MEANATRYYLASGTAAQLPNIQTAKRPNGAADVGPTSVEDCSGLSYKYARMHTPTTTLQGVDACISFLVVVFHNPSDRPGRPIDASVASAVCNI